MFVALTYKEKGIKKGSYGIEHLELCWLIKVGQGMTAKK